MRISIRHQLSVTPPPGTANAVLQVLLTPLSGPTQTVESWNLDMPGIGDAERFVDAYGNTVHLVNQSKPEGELAVTVTGVVVTLDRHGVMGRVSGEPVPALYKRVTPLTRVPVTVYGKFRTAKEGRIEVLHALMARVGEMLDTPQAMAQTQSQTLDGQSQSQSQGQMTADGGLVMMHEAEVGQSVAAKLPRPPATDYAHAFIGGARALNIPARYVTGYLAGHDDEPASFHAWAEAYDEALGWIGFDAMLQLCPTDRHVRVAAGLDSLSATPLRSVPAGDGARQVAVSVEAEQD